MNLPDTFYISLCMTILFIGAVYWVWTQLQYVQRKVNALENIVYELKQVCQQPKAPPAVMPTTMPAVMLAAMPAAPVQSYAPVDDEDILHDVLRSEIDSEIEQHQQQQQQQQQQDITPMPEEEDSSNIRTVTFEPEKGEFVFNTGNTGVLDIGENELAQEITTASDDLQPGGVGSGVVSHTSALDTMTLKELRRLANQRGISGVNDMKKKEIIAAIRALPSIDIFAADVVE
jgi:hypothetical protein